MTLQTKTTETKTDGENDGDGEAEENVPNGSPRAPRAQKPARARARRNVVCLEQRPHMHMLMRCVLVNLQRLRPWTIPTTVKDSQTMSNQSRRTRVPALVEQIRVDGAPCSSGKRRCVIRMYATHNCTHTFTDGGYTYTGAHTPAHTSPQTLTR